jgi:hypothetical protein
MLNIVLTLANSIHLWCVMRMQFLKNTTTHLFLTLFLLTLTSLCRADNNPSVALFYANNPPLDELHAFNVTVVDPDNANINAQSYRRKNSELFAYASVGEVRSDKPYFSKIPKAWLIGDNKNWKSQIIDQSASGWANFFSDNVIAPLWAKGYRGFFLDTLDSYQLVSKTPEARARQEAGLIATIREIKKRWPDAKLIFNRGFEILPTVHDAVWMVAAESLYQSWDAKNNQYTTVNDADRNWLLNQFKIIKTNYHLPVLVIDYVAPNQRALARKTAERIRTADFIPYVTDAALDMLGVGAVEVVPRKVIVIYDPRDTIGLQYSDAVRLLGMPLAYLGLVPEYYPITKPLPNDVLVGRYAGIVTWLNNDNAGGGDYATWLIQQKNQGLPIAVMSSFGFGSDPAQFAQLGLKYSTDAIPKDLNINHIDSMMGFEAPIKIQSDLPSLTLEETGKPLVQMTSADHANYTPAAITSWGGYVLSPYLVMSAPLAGKSIERWYINPLTFLTQALKIDTNVPVPDVTTEMGRRILMAHIDGDGFVSKAERPGYPFAGQVLLDDVLKRYPIPTAVSIIEGEIGPAGMYPELSPQLEPIAKKIFALPWVEIASHTYSHPFNWKKAQDESEDEASDSGESYHLPIKGYKFDLNREIEGSVNYINQRLAPPNKKVKILLWSGNCVSTPDALAETYKAGVLNMNGGDTVITRARNSWTNIAGLGVPKGGYYQVFAPDQNENVYTNLWTGPFYGFERVIETYQLTETPYRFKPIDIYYHLYNVTKTASLNTLYKIYDWALSQPVNTIYPSQYIQKVLDFNHYVVARTPQGYRLHGDGDLLTVRLPKTGEDLNFVQSNNVAGITSGPEARYVSLTSGDADLVLGDHKNQPYLAWSNGHLTHFERQGLSFNFGLTGYQPLTFALAQTNGCSLIQNNQILHPIKNDQGNQIYQLRTYESQTLQLNCKL